MDGSKSPTNHPALKSVIFACFISTPEYESDDDHRQTYELHRCD